jgi:hypothetical protein
VKPIRRIVRRTRPTETVDALAELEELELLGPRTFTVSDAVSTTDGRLTS